jgi:hypothetical protein
MREKYETTSCGFEGFGSGSDLPAWARFDTRTSPRTVTTTAVTSFVSLVNKRRKLLLEDSE